MASCHFGYFWPKKHPFSDPPGPGITPGWGRKVPNTPLPIAWAVFWPIIQFPGWFFRAIWQPVIWVTFYPKNTHFRTHLDLELHLDGAEKCPTHLSPLLGLCFGPLSSFQVDFFAQYGNLWFGLLFTQKTPIFGPTWTWNYTWMGQKSAQHIFPHCLGCVLAHYSVSRWVIGLVWQPTMMVHFEPKKGLFLAAPWLENSTWSGLNGLKPPSHMYKEATGAFRV